MHVDPDLLARRPVSAVAERQAVSLLIAILMDPAYPERLRCYLQGRCQDAEEGSEEQQRMAADLIEAQAILAGHKAAAERYCEVLGESLDVEDILCEARKAEIERRKAQGRLEKALGEDGYGLDGIAERAVRRIEQLEEELRESRKRRRPRPTMALRSPGWRSIDETPPAGALLLVADWEGTKQVLRLGRAVAKRLLDGSCTWIVPGADPYMWQVAPEVPR